MTSILIFSKILKIVILVVSCKFIFLKSLMFQLFLFDFMIFVSFVFLAIEKWRTNLIPYCCVIIINGLFHFWYYYCFIVYNNFTTSKLENIFWTFTYHKFVTWQKVAWQIQNTRKTISIKMVVFKSFENIVVKLNFFKVFTETFKPI